MAQQVNIVLVDDIDGSAAQETVVFALDGKEHRARRKLLAQYRVESGKGFRLKDHDPDDTAGLKADKAAGKVQSAIGGLKDTLRGK